MIPVSDIRVDMLEHIESSLVDSDESGIVDLSESEESEDSLDSWGKAVDTKIQNYY